MVHAIGSAVPRCPVASETQVAVDLWEQGSGTQVDPYALFLSNGSPRDGGVRIGEEGVGWLNRGGGGYKPIQTVGWWWFVDRTEVSSLFSSSCHIKCSFQTTILHLHTGGGIDEDSESLQPFGMAWTCASTSTNTSCWRSQVMDKHYRPRHSAKQCILILLGLDTFIVNLILKYTLLRKKYVLNYFFKGLFYKL